MSPRQQQQQQHRTELLFSWSVKSLAKLRVCSSLTMTLLSRPLVAGRLLLRSMSSSSSAIRAVIIGAPGSGKGTISKWLVRDFELKHLSSGDLLRKHIEQDTDVGKEAKRYIDKGDLVPDDTMCLLNRVRLIGSEVSSFGPSSPWLLDGFPRTITQAQALESVAKVNVVLYLNVPFQTIVERVKDRWIHPGSGRVYNALFNPPKVEGVDDETGEKLIQREDDKPENVLNRLKVFEKNTQPVLDYYAERKVLQEFQGTESKKIWPHVEDFLKKRFDL